MKKFVFVVWLVKKMRQGRGGKEKWENEINTGEGGSKKTCTWKQKSVHCY